MNAVKKQQGTIEYFVKGERPTLLLLSGMHGDEAGVIDCVIDYVDRHIDTLPNFLFIPKVSPSAVALKTRTNTFGHDINRNFFDPPTDPEAKDVMDIISRYQFDHAIDFHEDPDLKDEFYMYCGMPLSSTNLDLFRTTMRKTGVRLHTGIDDLADANLGLHVEDGYICTPIHSFPPEAGFSGEWFLDHKIATYVFTPEIPGQATPALKQAVVDEIFSFILNTPHS